MGFQIRVLIGSRKPEVADNKLFAFLIKNEPANLYVSTNANHLKNSFNKEKYRKKDYTFVA